MTNYTCISTPAGVRIQLCSNTTGFYNFYRLLGRIKYDILNDPKYFKKVYFDSTQIKKDYLTEMYVIVYRGSKRIDKNGLTYRFRLGMGLSLSALTNYIG